MKGTLERQFKNPDIKRILRPRPELKYKSRKVNYKKLCSGIKPTIKEDVFEALDNSQENDGSEIILEPNLTIAEDIRSCTGEFLDLGDEAFCQYIQDWKDENLTKE